MPILLLPLPSFPSKNLGEYAECSLPVQGRESFNSIFLRVAGQGAGVAGAPLSVLDCIDTIELLESGVSVMTVTPYALRLLEGMKNVNADTLDVSVIQIPLARLGLANLSDWPTGFMQKFQLRVKIKATFPSNGVNPAMTLTELNAYARIDELPAPLPRGDVFTFHMASHLPVTGDNVIESLSLRNLTRITKILMFCPLAPGTYANTASRAISRVKITAGRTVVYDSTKQIAIAELAASPLYRGSPEIFSLTSDCFPVIFDVTGSPLEYLDLVSGGTRKTLKVEYTWAAGTAPQSVHFLTEGILVGAEKPLVETV